MRIERMSVLPDDLITAFRGLYRESFEDMDRRAAARQSLTDEEFVEEMHHEAVEKWVAWTEDGQAAGLAFMTADLSLVPWISIPYYANRFPEHYARNAIFYFGSLVVHPDHRGGPAARTLIAECCRYSAAAEAIIAFDCCEFNVDVVRLPEMIARISGRVAVVQPHELDAQRYYAYEMKEAG